MASLAVRPPRPSLALLPMGAKRRDPRLRDAQRAARRAGPVGGDLMSMVAFFPWFALSAPRTFGRFKLVPHEVGATNPIVPGYLDSIFTQYRTQKERPI